MIKPTVGRVVHFHPNGDPAIIFAAIITYVHSDDCINVCAFLPNGLPVCHTSVKLLQDGEVPTPGWNSCEWMSFQKGQVAAADTPGGLPDRVGALEAQIRELNPGLLPRS